MMNADNDTILFYNKHAADFVRKTVNVEFTGVQDRFLKYITDHGIILDFGCGSGRDTKYFLDKGYTVTAVDGSEELCRLAEEHTGIKVKCMLFNELDETATYDGIWACSSILHLSHVDLKDVFYRMIKAVKSGGYIYTSFKYGTFEGERNGRYFTDFTEETFGDFIADIPGICIVEQWISADARPGRGEEKWLNLILQITDSN